MQQSPRCRTGSIRTQTLVYGTIALGCFWLGRQLPLTPSQAAPPPAQVAAAATPAANSEYSQRVVAFIYDKVPITREELGEYLIARQGSDKLDLLVNKRIIEVACQQRGMEVTAAEVEAALAEDLRTINVNKQDFVSKVLKQYGKTLYEWKEDVIRPRLLLTKICRDRIQVTDEDIQKMFDGLYGPKAEVKIIIYPKGEEKIAFEKYDKIRSSEEEFHKAATQQATSSLAATGGSIKPIGKGMGTHPEVEREAFLLQPGQTSRLIGTPEGTIVMRCIKQHPADDTKKFADEKEKLYRECYERKQSAEIPVLFKQLREQAKPVMILKPDTSPAALEREVLPEIQQTGATQK